MTTDEKNRLKKLEKEYSFLLKNQPLVDLATEKLSNHEKKINEAEYRQKAIDLIDPLFDVFTEVCQGQK
ncbi:MAG: hypothetical protein HOC82_10410 [Bacteroidetes bacterium]|jgi:hypothetical protein|nr:hypothetical protein [Bacteroidota bacterium]